MIWIDTVDAMPPHVDDAVKTARLVESLRDGWDGAPLIGYPWDGKIQLLSGSHRWAASRILGRKVPVILVRRVAVEAAWGDLDEWARVMEEAE